MAAISQQESARPYRSSQGTASTVGPGEDMAPRVPGNEPRVPLADCQIAHACHVMNPDGVLLTSTTAFGERPPSPASEAGSVGRHPLVMSITSNPSQNQCTCLLLHPAIPHPESPPRPAKLKMVPFGVQSRFLTESRGHSISRFGSHNSLRRFPSQVNLTLFDLSRLRMFRAWACGSRSRRIKSDRVV